jgi:MSHA biogenesis protein MshQ
MPFNAICRHNGLIASMAVFAALLFDHGFARAALIVSYPMNEANWSGSAPQVTDISGNSNNGTVVGGANTISDGMFGLAGSFSGNGQYVKVGGSLNIQGARSIVAWVNPQANSLSNGLPIITGGVAGTGDFFGVAGTGGENSGVLHYALYVDHWNYTAYRSSTLVTPNQWNFVAMTYDGANTVNFYINGAPAGSITSNGLYNYGLSTYTIGGNAITGSTTVGSFAGQLHDVQIYNNTLSASDVHDLYLAAIPEPSSGILLLLGGAIGGLILLRRRSNRPKPITN